MDEYFVEGQMCPCCGEYKFQEDDNFEYCQVCGWQDDGIQREDPEYDGGANRRSLNQAKAEWEDKKALKAAR